MLRPPIEIPEREIWQVLFHNGIVDGILVLQALVMKLSMFAAVPGCVTRAG
jgi:hypothetical protein